MRNKTRRQTAAETFRQGRPWRQRTAATTCLEDDSCLRIGAADGAGAAVVTQHRAAGVAVVYRHLHAVHKHLQKTVLNSSTDSKGGRLKPRISTGWHNTDCNSLILSACDTIRHDTYLQWRCRGRSSRLHGVSFGGFAVVACCLANLAIAAIASLTPVLLWQYTRTKAPWQHFRQGLTSAASKICPAVNMRPMQYLSAVLSAHTGTDLGL